MDNPCWRQKNKPKYELPKTGRQSENYFDLREEALSYRIYGGNYIEQGALDQMQTAMKLPISLAGALMPDAHQGYGLPIGGVLATKANTVIPYAVGVDIACRMCMSVFDLPVSMIQREDKLLKKCLKTIVSLGWDQSRSRNMMIHFLTARNGLRQS
jgi:tRNA-splicing ligase RtcB